MNLSILVDSLRYFDSNFTLVVSLATWINYEISSLFYRSNVLTQSLDIEDFEVASSIIRFEDDQEQLNFLLQQSFTYMKPAIDRWDENGSLVDYTIVKDQYDVYQRLKILLEAGADVDAQDSRILRDATRNISRIDNIEIVNLILKYKPNVHARNDISFRNASVQNDIEVTKLLLEAGADVNSEKCIAIIIACREANIKMINLLLSYGADMHSDALTCSSEEGQLEVVKLLISLGADVCAYNNRAIMHACDNGQLEVVKLLLDTGVDLQDQINEALILASNHSDDKMLKYLLSLDIYDIDIHTEDDEPLRCATKYNEIDIARTLLEHGATVLDEFIIMAIEKGHDEMVTLFNEYRNRK